MEIPLSEGEGLEDLESDTATGFVCVGEHGRQGLCIGAPRTGAHQDSPQHRSHSKEVVVMRKLALSERRDSFKKQEAVQEVSFDDLEETTPSPTLPATPTKGFKASWITPQSTPASPQSASSPKPVGKGSQGMTQQNAKSRDKEGYSFQK